MEKAINTLLVISRLLLAVSGVTFFVIPADRIFIPFVGFCVSVAGMGIAIVLKTNK